MRSSVFLIVGLLVISCSANHKGAISTISTNPPSANLEVVLRPGQERLWHHLGDELLVVRGNKTLLAIKLAQASDYEVPLTLTLCPEGRILYWGEYFDNPQLASGLTTRTLFNCDGRLLQQFKTVLFASFDFANGDSAVITLSLPKEGIEYWALREVDERHAALSRYIDPCYVDLLKRGEGR